NPTYPVYHSIDRSLRAEAAKQRAAAGDHAAARREAVAIAGLKHDAAEDAAGAALALAGCAPPAQGGNASAGPGRPLALLREPVGKGYKDLHALKNADGLAPLRSRADFQALLAEVEKRAKGR